MQKPISSIVIAVALSGVRKSLGLAIATALAGALMAPTAIAAPIAIYWTDRDNASLFRNDLQGNNTELVPPTGGRLQDVDLDLATGTLFFSDWGPVGFPGGEGSINQVNTDGTGLAMVLSTGDAVHQLALDPANSKIYFTRSVSYDGREISVVDTNGSNYTVLTTPDWFASGLALDSANNKLYWGDIGVLDLGTPRGAVNVMNTNGTSPTDLEPHVDGRGRGFALHNGIIYLTAHDPLSPGSGGGIFTYDIANDVLTQIISDPTTGFWDIEVDPIDQRIYFTNYVAGTIESAKFDGTDRVIVLSGLSNPYGLALEFASNEPPDCSAAGADPAGLWPPNHKFVPIGISGVTDPDGDPVSITVDSIRQDEPVKEGGTGSGNTCPDATGVGTSTAQVRAERAGNKKVPGDGRVYHIGFTADDGMGGTCKGEVLVCVPHDQGQGSTCVDGGALFDSTVCP